ncbi:MAG: hypothetical protein JO174_12050, partial [Herbaspirillum sp.]|nr:hypothetical protein [Herbaspirillum sp.]
AGNDVAFQTAQDIVNSGTNINQVASVSGKDITMAAGRDVSLGTVNENFRQQINRANDGGASNWIGTLIGPNLVDRSNGVHRISESGVNRATLTGSKDVSTPKSVATTSACAPVRTW